MLNHFLIADLEATGTNPLAAEVLTGSFLYCDSDLNVIDRYDLESRPRIWSPEAEEAVAIHGITHAVAMRFTPFQTAMPAFSDWLDTLEPAHFVAHANRTIFKKAGEMATYDYALLNTLFFDINRQWSLYRVAPVKYIISTHSLAKYLNLPCAYNLKDISQYLGLDAFTHHNAAADTNACHGIVQKLLPRVNLDEFFLFENFKLKPEVENESGAVSRIYDTNKSAIKKPSRVQKNTSRLI